MIVYAFDVDETLEVSGGPVKLQAVADLKSAGHVVGVCGNWPFLVRAWPAWHYVFSFLSAHGQTKAEFLIGLKMFLPADDYVMVGNDGDGTRSSADKAAAEQAGWRFVLEREFAGGAR